MKFLRAPMYTNVQLLLSRLIKSNFQKPKNVFKLLYLARFFLFLSENGSILFYTTFYIEWNFQVAGTKTIKINILIYTAYFIVFTRFFREISSFSKKKLRTKKMTDITMNMKDWQNYWTELLDEIPLPIKWFETQKKSTSLYNRK